MDISDIKPDPTATQSLSGAELPPAHKLEMVAGRNAEGKSLEVLHGYSSTVVNQVDSTGKALVVTGTDEGRALGSESAVLHNLRSIMAVPLQVRDKVIGVVYLDSNLAKGLFTDDDLEMLGAISNFIAVAFQNSRMANVEAARRLLEKDMALVAAVQSMFLPKNPDFTSPQLKLSGHYEAASTASGDWWWHEYDEEEQALTVFLGDVTGHGAASAMLTASTAGTLKSLMRSGRGRSMLDILNDLNRDFFEIAGGKFNMTMLAVRICIKTQELSVWSAGAPPAFLATADGRPQSLVARGSPLGSSEFLVGTREIILQPADRLLLYTDGLVELALPQGRMLKAKRLVQLLSETQGMNIQDTKTYLLDKINAARAGTPLEDDVTFVIVDFIGDLVGDFVAQLPPT